MFITGGRDGIGPNAAYYLHTYTINQKESRYVQVRQTDRQIDIQTPSIIFITLN